MARTITSRTSSARRHCRRGQPRRPRARCRDPRSGTPTPRATRCSRARSRSSSEHEGDVAQAGRLPGARRRHDLGLEERDAPAELAHEDRPVVLARLVSLLEPENVAIPRDRRRPVADVQRDVVEPVEPERRHVRPSVSSSRGTSGQAPSLQFEMTVAGHLRHRIVERAERHARVVALEHHRVRRAVEPEAEAVPAPVRPSRSAGASSRRPTRGRRSCLRRAPPRTPARPQRSCRCHRRRSRAPAGGARSCEDRRRRGSRAPCRPAARPSAGTPCRASRPARTRAARRARGTGRRSLAPRSARARRSRRCSTRSARRARTSSDTRRAPRGSPRCRRAGGRAPAAGSR